MFRSTFILPRKAFKDMWFLFDFFLVTMMVAETWIVPMFVLIMDDSTFDIFGRCFKLYVEDISIDILSKDLGVCTHRSDVINMI